MKKDTIRWVIGLGVLLVLYILVVFLFPFERNAIFWVSVIFTLTAAVDELQEAYVDGDGEAVKQLCRKVDALLAERNRLCKLNKQ